MRWRILLAVIALFTSHAVQAFDWADLWRTPEQQAQQLLDAGKAAEAAQRFTDPRRKAYAQARASQHAAAASTLAEQKDADSLFNRSNALAHAGKLEEALAGYEAALKQLPNDKDITRNRDLVKQALQKKQEQQQQQQGGQQDQQAQSGKDGQQQDQPGGQSGQKQKDQDKDQQKSTQHSSASSSAASSTAGQGGAQQSSAAASSQAQAPKQGSAQSSASARDEAEQARRDAEGALKAKQSQPAPAPQKAQAAPASQAAEPEKGQPGRALQQVPKSEEALAMDQWLRRIPDDPGGLLRRKFMIEHRLRQQEKAR